MDKSETSLIKPPHISVMVSEVLEYLNPQPGGLYLDATFGVGGHSRAILEREPNCRVIALDWDTNVIEQFGHPMMDEFGDRFSAVWGDFSFLHRILRKEGIKQLDGVLADVGTSQVQIRQEAGFSVYRDAPLDMRMSTAHHRTTAADVVNNTSEKELADIFFRLGEERYSRKIAREIVSERKKNPITHTLQLAKLVEKLLGWKERRDGSSFHPATRVFQALRIHVNKELDNIKAFLISAFRVLKPGGRCVCISFHSLEDRLVKHMFREYEQEGKVEIITKRAVVPSTEEIARNSSARSAKLRSAEKLV